MSLRSLFLLLPAAILTFCGCRTVPDNPILQNGKVMFWGDSITAGKMYASYFESFYRTRYPEGNAIFVERGWGGDQAGNLARIRRDGMPEKADLIYIMYGMNDADYSDRDPAASMKQFRADLLAGMKLFREANPQCRFVLMSSPTMEVNVKENRQFYPWVLRCHAREMEKLARELGIPYIDQNLLYSGFAGAAANMFSPEKLQQGKQPSGLKPFRLSSDGIHPNRGGQSVIAMNMFPEVSDLSVITYDHATRTVNARGCNLSPLSVSPDGRNISITRQLQRLPFALPPDAAYMEPLLLLSEKVNRDLFYARNLPAGTWRLSIDGEKYWDFSADDLSEGINLSDFSRNPDMEQSRKVMKFVEIKNQEERKVWMKRLNGDLSRYPDPKIRWGSVEDPWYIQKQYEIEARTAAIKFHSGAYYHEIALEFLPDTPAVPWRSRFRRSLPMEPLPVIIPENQGPQKARLPLKIENPTGKNQHMEFYLKQDDRRTFLDQGIIKVGQNLTSMIPVTISQDRPEYTLQAFYQPEDRSFPRMNLSLPVCLVPALDIPYAEPAALEQNSWQNAARVSLDEARVPGRVRSHWQNRSDLSAEAYLAWNQKGLELKVQVRDDIHLPPEKADQNFWNYDGLQFGFWIPQGKKWLNFSDALFADRNGRSLLMRNGARISPENDALLKGSVRRTDGLTVYILHIPWKTIGCSAPQKGSEFRFNFGINDRDRQDGTWKCMPWSHGIWFSNLSEEYGRIRLR